MKNKSKAKVRAKKIEPFIKIVPSGMGYVMLKGVDEDTIICLNGLVNNTINAKYGKRQSSASVKALEEYIEGFKSNLSGEGSPSETLLEEIVNKAKRLGYDELTFNW